VTDPEAELPTVPKAQLQTHDEAVLAVEFATPPCTGGAPIDGFDADRLHELSEAELRVAELAASGTDQPRDQPEALDHGQHGGATPHAHLPQARGQRPQPHGRGLAVVRGRRATHPAGVADLGRRGADQCRAAVVDGAAAAFVGIPASAAAGSSEPE
jgi:hypothetical protein